MTDRQRLFYESGYSAPRGAAEDFLAGISRLDGTERVCRAAGLLKGASGTFLDLGCGSGSLLYLVRNRFSHLIGVDIADAQLNRVRGWATVLDRPVALHRLNVDQEPLPLPDGSVDAAACIVVLEFVFDPENAMREICRVLRPGGMFVGSVGNIAAWRNRLRLLAGRAPATTTFAGAVNGGALHTFTQSTFLELLRCAGFELDVVGCSGWGWAARSAWPSLLGGDIFVRAYKK